jgi:peptidoglycan/LPS O-acetylase OafA/YrhL
VEALHNAAVGPKTTRAVDGRVRAGDIPELTTLRIAAAMCVIVSHLDSLRVVSAEHLHAVLDGGRPAVSFFFILSGFIMNHNYPTLRWTDATATKQYARSRVARLYPTLVLALAIAAPVGLYLMMSNNRAQLLTFYALKDRYSAWLGVSALAQLTGTTGWFPVAAINQPWNGPAWSLSCEFFFYALFPFIRPALARRSSRSLILLIIVGWILQGLWIAAIKAYIPPNRAGFLVSQFPIIHCFEFVLGICSGMLLVRLTSRQLAGLMLVSGAVSMLVFIQLHVVHPLMPAFFGFSPLFAAFIVLTAIGSGSVWLKPLRNRVLVALGHASYALYMIHVPILVAASVLGVAAIFGWIWVPFLLLASCAVHFYFADPVRRRLLGRRTRSTKRPPPAEGPSAHLVVD